GTCALARTARDMASRRTATNRFPSALSTYKLACPPSSRPRGGRSRFARSDANGPASCPALPSTLRPICSSTSPNWSRSVVCRFVEDIVVRLFFRLHRGASRMKRHSANGVPILGTRPHAHLHDHLRDSAHSGECDPNTTVNVVHLAAMSCGTPFGV